MELKKMYGEYVIMYKKKLDEFPKSTESVSFIKQNDEFPFVNRSASYLSDEAVNFAKKFNLEDPVRRLYNEQDTFIMPKQINKKNKKNLMRFYNSYSAIKKGDYLLQWPIDQSQFWMSSKFGPRKKNKKDGEWKFHYGIDLAAMKGTPVKSAADGHVIEVAYSKKGYGKTIVIKHNHCQTRYAHLEKIYVKLGQSVRGGQLIASVGNSGFVWSKHGIEKASHLHFEVKEMGKHIDPLLVLA